MTASPAPASSLDLIGSQTRPGPVESRLRQLLEDGYDTRGRGQGDRDHPRGDGFEVSVAKRSPVGPGALRIRPKTSSGSTMDDSCRKLESWLDARRWVEAAAARPPNVYLLIGIDTLRSWLSAGFGAGDPASSREGGSQPVVVRWTDSGHARRQSLDEAREAVVGLSVTALLRSRGFAVSTDPRSGETASGETASSETVSDGCQKPTRSTVIGIGRAGGGNGASMRVEVGEVDVRHGALRARYGGSLCAEDLMNDVRRRVADGSDAATSSTTMSWREEDGQRFLSFLLLRVERARHLQLTEAKLKSEIAAFRSILAARQLARDGGSPLRHDRGAAPPPAAAASLRELAGELEVLAWTAARAAGQLEPAFLARYLCNLAGRAHAAAPSLGSNDPLWSVLGKAIDSAFARLAIGSAIGFHTGHDAGHRTTHFAFQERSHP